MNSKHINLLMIGENGENVGMIQSMLTDLETYSFAIRSTDNPENCLKIFSEKSFGAVILDVSQQQNQAYDYLKTIQAVDPNIAIFIFTDCDDFQLDMQMLSRGVQDIFIKNQIDSNVLARTIALGIARKNIETNLQSIIRENETQRAEFAAIIAGIGDGLEILDREFRITFQNQVSKDLMGDHVGEFCFEAYNNSKNICEGCPVTLSFNDGKIHTLERSLVLGEKKLQLEITASPVRDKEGNIIAGIEVVRDITKRKRAEEALKESEENYRDLFENSSDIIQNVMADGRFIYTNRAWHEILKYDHDDLTRLTTYDIFHPDNRAEAKKLFDQVFEGKNIDSVVEFELLAKNQSKVIIEATFHTKSAEESPISCWCIFRDITERKKIDLEKMKMQDQLILAQKIEAVGTLAGGVAHDFNNLLTAISGYNELTMRTTEEKDPRYGNLLAINRACNRAAEIIRQLLFFSRQHTLEFKPVDINSVVSSMFEMLDRFVGNNIELHTDLEKNIWPILSDEGSLEQVLMSLVVNARDAMPEGGKLIIQTRKVTIGKKYCETVPSARLGDFVCLSVADTGYGMDEQVMKSIFDPFFTTKDVGKGTGLGLSGIYGILKQHQGWIDVESMPGRGAKFSVFFEAISDKLRDLTAD